jgi:hypothetical protein
MNTDHIVHNSKTQRMECQHCGFTQAVKMPAPIDAILQTFDAFMEAHKACQRPQSETVMSEYIKGFDAGYGYVLNEIERYINVYPTDVFAVKELLAHLKMEGKKDTRETT